ncbi:hypothetical protein [Henriciella aquimarina]|uniref:hypothetical protein n=1 Tax=Henriciella aquimarina TaxID=545261 RepID=UPI000A038881|nr:hypothetical protein [Henriciella aquimarina]
MRGWGLFLLVVLQAQQASAGPWGRADEQVYARLAVSRVSLESLDAVRLDSYGEYGLDDDWTLTLKYERLQFDDFSEYDKDGWRITARRSFNLPKSLIASLEAGALKGEAIGGAAGCEALGAEVRAGLGQSAQIGKKQKWDLFWFAEGAVRAHEDGCVRHRLEAGYGQQLVGDLWTVSQIWLDEGSANARSRKYQFELLWKSGFADVSLGTTTEFGGAFEETAAFLALAKTF